MTFDRKVFDVDVDRMFDRVEDQVIDIVKVWQIKVMTAVVLATYGPGNQWPNTPYVATGRLRAGWQWSFEDPPDRIPVERDGPSDDSGSATIGRLSLRILQGDIEPVVYAYNNVFYAWLVHEGKGGHTDIGPRPWVEIEVNRADRHLDDARRDVMARG